MVEKRGLGRGLSALLGDVDEADALLAAGESGRHPVDDDVGATAGDHLLGSDVGAAGLDGDVEAGVLIETLVLGNVVAGELGLRHPLELQRHGVGGKGVGGAEGRGEAESGEKRLVHGPVPLF